MKLLEAIALVAHNNPAVGLIIDDEVMGNDREHIDAASRFLYARNYDPTNAQVITSQTLAIVEQLELTGDDFEYINRGGNSAVYGNDEVVLHLVSSNAPMLGFIPVDSVPEGLSARIIDSGECNGVSYRLSERFSKVGATLIDVVPFLFKARDNGVTYEDVQSNNFGFDRNGEFKTLDPKHFQLLNKPPGNFEESLRRALETFTTIRLPVITMDEENTYVILPNQNASLLQKQLYAALNGIGVDTSNIEAINDPPVLRIPQTKVRMGRPPESMELADFVKQTLERITKPLGRDGSISKQPSH